MQTVTLSNGVVMQVPDGVNITVSGAATPPPSVAPIQYNVTATGTLVEVSGPTNPLDQVYFSEADLVAACQAHNLQNTVVINNNENFHQAWPVAGGQPGPTPTPTPPPSSGGSTGVLSYTVSPAPTSGQIRPTFPDLGGQTLEVIIAIPASFPYNGKPLNPIHSGFIHIAELPGAQAIGRDITITDAAGNVLWTDINDTAPAVNWCIGKANQGPTGANFSIELGGTIIVWQKIPGYTDGMNTGTLVDIAYPWRY